MSEGETARRSVLVAIAGLGGPKPRGARFAIITGASAGLGLALARRLVADGWMVLGVDRDQAAVSDEGYRHVRCDLADPEQVDALAAELARGGDVLDRLDLVVMCAGVSATGRFEAIPADAHARVLAINAEAPLVLGDALLGAGWSRGTLVLVASLSVDVGYPGAASYAASKDALAAYGRSIGKARRSPRVLTVLPGPTRTEHAARHAPAGASDAARMNPDDLAKRILRAVGRGARVLRPGLAARIAGRAGRLAPGLTAWLMRRGLFEKLDRAVW